MFKKVLSALTVAGVLFMSMGVAHAAELNPACTGTTNCVDLDGYSSVGLLSDAQGVLSAPYYYSEKYSQAYLEGTTGSSTNTGKAATAYTYNYANTYYTYGGTYSYDYDPNGYYFTVSGVLAANTTAVVSLTVDNATFTSVSKRLYDYAAASSATADLELALQYATFYTLFANWSVVSGSATTTISFLVENATDSLKAFCVEILAYIDGLSDTSTVTMAFSIVPLPSAFLLFMTGLLALVAFVAFRKAYVRA